MKRILVLTAGVLAVALTVAACGARSSAATAPTKISTTVGTRQVPGLGTILVSSAGLPLYVNDQDTGGMATCNGACALVWPQLKTSAAPTEKGVTGTLGVIKGTSGASQVTLNGRPLYTFIADRSGGVTGNGFHDHYGSQKFSWHVMLANGTTPPASASPSKSAGSGGSSGGFGGY